MTSHRMLLLAQSPVLRFGIRSLVDAHWPGGEILEAENGLDAYQLGSEFAPNIAILQDALAGVTGMMTARIVREHAPAAHIIVLADDPSLAMRAAGEFACVDAVLPSEIEPADLINVLKNVVHTDPARCGSACPALEIAVLDGVARGLTLEAISVLTGVPDLNHALHALLTRFEASNATALVTNAIRRGWIDPHVRLPGAATAMSFAVAA